MKIGDGDKNYLNTYIKQAGVLYYINFRGEEGKIFENSYRTLLKKALS